ncbi:hypothetical protein ACLOJK_006774 [Asimina triloba]
MEDVSNEQIRCPTDKDPPLQEQGTSSSGLPHFLYLILTELSIKNNPSSLNTERVVLSLLKNLPKNAAPDILEVPPKGPSKILSQPELGANSPVTRVEFLTLAKTMRTLQHQLSS